MTDADVAIVGAGAAGLSLARELTAPRAAGRAAPRVVLLEAPEGPRRPGQRTWCFWEDGPGELDPLVAASWGRVRLYGTDGAPVDAPLGRRRYKMVRSVDFEPAVRAELAARGGVELLEGTVEGVADSGGGARVDYHDASGTARALTARWVFDSRPPPAWPAARTLLLQHFRGWHLRTPSPAFDPGAAVWMDFRTPQPEVGCSFGYVLPLGEREALVEYTEFSSAALSTGAYERALEDYARRVVGLEEWTVVSTEQGVIPMTDGRFTRRTGASVFRIGTASGATRPATGYTFAAIQRQARAVADAFRAGRTPVPPPPHSLRARTMDAAFLRALATGRVEGAEFFTRLFSRNPPGRILRFLDGRSSPREDVAIGLSTPFGPMLRSTLELPFVPRRDRSRHDQQTATSGR